MIFNLYRLTLCSVALLFLPCANVVAAEQPGAGKDKKEEQPPPGHGFLSVYNATGLPGDVMLTLNGTNPFLQGFGPGSGTGQVGYAPGPVILRAAHPRCEHTLEKPFEIKKDENLIVLVYAVDKEDPKTGEIKNKLEFAILPARESSGKFTLSLFNCDPKERIPAVEINNVSVDTPKLQPVHLPTEKSEAAYQLTVQRKDIMETYYPSVQEHCYFVIYIDKQELQPMGFPILDPKVVSSPEEDARLRQEMEQRLAVEAVQAKAYKNQLDAEALATEQQRAERRRLHQKAPENRQPQR